MTLLQYFPAADCGLYYDLYKLLHVVCLNKTYAKYRISELNQLKSYWTVKEGFHKSSWSIL